MNACAGHRCLRIAVQDGNMVPRSVRDDSVVDAGIGVVAHKTKRSIQDNANTVVATAAHHQERGVEGHPCTWICEIGLTVRYLVRNFLFLATVS